MFVEIDKTDMNVIEIEKMIREAIGKDGVVSPDFAMDILSRTNNTMNIRKIVKNIEKNCTTKEQLMPYKEFIVSCGDSRELSTDVANVLYDLAKKCGCEDEFYSACYEKPNLYSSYSEVIVRSREEFEACKDKHLPIYFAADKVDLSFCDFSGIEQIRYKDGAKVSLRGARNLPKYLDVSKCSEVDLSRCDLNGVEQIMFSDGVKVSLRETKNLPVVLDLSMCSKVDVTNADLRDVKEIRFKDGADINFSAAYEKAEKYSIVMESSEKPFVLDEDGAIIVHSREEFEALKGENLKVSFDADVVDLRDCDLSKVETIKFKEGAKVDLSYSNNLSEHLDVSMCDKVDLSKCDLSYVELKFKEGAEVNLSYSRLPKDLDVSMCDKVDMGGCDLEGLNLKFKEGAEVDLSYSRLPKDLDVSMCDKIDLSMCDLEELKLKFREGAFVELRWAKNLPEVLDLSMCDKVDMGGCALSSVKEIKFKDKEQQMKFMKGVENFNGKVIFDKDKGGVGMVPPGHGGAEM